MLIPVVRQGGSQSQARIGSRCGAGRHVAGVDETIHSTRSTSRSEMPRLLSWMCLYVEHIMGLWKSIKDWHLLGSTRSSPAKQRKSTLTRSSSSLTTAIFTKSSCRLSCQLLYCLLETTFFICPIFLLNKTDRYS
jgi:hypothetical protein